MVPDDLLDDEAEDLLRELRVQPRLDGELAQSPDLFGFPLRVRRRQPVGRFELADLLGAPEALREQMDQRRVEVVDAGAQLGEPGLRRAVEIRHLLSSLASRSVGRHGSHPGATVTAGRPGAPPS
jgi:hypothetical protein